MRFKNHLLAAVAAGLFVTAALPAGASTIFLRDNFEITKEDRQMLRAAAKELYGNDARAVGDLGAWTNKDTGNKGTVEIIQLFEEQGLNCVRLQHDIYVKDAGDHFRYTIDRCRTEAGEWKLL